LTYLLQNMLNMVHHLR